MENDLNFKIKTLSKKNMELEKEIKFLNQSKYELDARLKILESEDMQKIKHEIHALENSIHKLELHHDDRKQRINTIFNFIIQLIWVAMAAWLLTKLGLQPPL